MLAKRGTCVGCLDCGVMRELGDFDPPAVFDRSQVETYQRFWVPYGAALLATFMGAHRGHRCVMFNGSDDSLRDELHHEDADFWD